MSEDPESYGWPWHYDEQEGTPWQMVVETISRALSQGCGEIAVCEILPGVSLLVYVGNSSQVQETARALITGLHPTRRGH
jgi:hypothetical protein